MTTHANRTNQTDYPDPQTLVPDANMSLAISFRTMALRKPASLCRADSPHLLGRLRPMASRIRSPRDCINRFSILHFKCKAQSKKDSGSHGFWDTSVYVFFSPPGNQEPQSNRFRPFRRRPARMLRADHPCGHDEPEVVAGSSLCSKSIMVYRKLVNCHLLRHSFLFLL